MTNIHDYLTWRGDLPLHADGWNDIDSLIMSCLSYVDMPLAARDAVTLSELPATVPAAPKDSETWAFFQRCRTLVEPCAKSVRFGGIRLHSYVNQVDPDRDMQFSAVTADLPDGTRFVAFRGTDQSIVGWREDFTMAFESPVPAQTAALQYLEQAAQAGRPLRLGGHSKGGNLSTYAAAHADPSIQALILSVCSFDGPGLDDETFASAGYARIQPRIRSYLPQTSVVGLLMAHHEDYTVVRSAAFGLAQHDAFTWQVLGKGFVELEEVDKASQVVDQSLHAWLMQVSPDQRRIFVNTLFDILESTNATTLRDLTNNKRATLSALWQAARSVDRATVLMIAQLVGRFIRTSTAAIMDVITNRADPEALSAENDDPQDE